MLFQLGSSLRAPQLLLPSLGFIHRQGLQLIHMIRGRICTRNDDKNPPAWPVDAGDIVLLFRNGPRLPVKFYLGVGRFDSLVQLNREMRDALLLKGYMVTYREFDGGPGTLPWLGFDRVEPNRSLLTGGHCRINTLVGVASAG
jgi:hypothetical protein